MERHPADWWAKRIEEIDRGGDPAVIAARHGVRPKTLVWWRSELSRRARKRGGQALLPVVVESSVASADVEVVLEIGRARLQVRGALTADHLAALARALGAPC